jgi:methylthioribose-1-phosphate isomerase
MNVDGKAYRTIWSESDRVFVIDQTLLPHDFAVLELRHLADAAVAIESMVVRGAPLIGATAAFGMALAMREDPSALDAAYQTLIATRPTAVNLRWALDRLHGVLKPLAASDRAAAAMSEARRIADEDVCTCRELGRHGLEIVRDVWRRAGEPDRLNIMTHCNAGWLAAVDWGTALAPVYQAFAAGIPVHVWVDETRPRNQGASLTAWELGKHGVAHTVIVDNVGGHLMQHGLVDLCIVGTDRTTAQGDVCNKIGTYLKALAAHANNVPFYVALPSSTIDWTIHDGLRSIPIEQRNAEEITHITGLTRQGQLETVQLTPKGTPAANYAFDVTPARYVTGLITERGVCPASEKGLRALFP